MWWHLPTGRRPSHDESAQTRTEHDDPAQHGGFESFEFRVSCPASRAVCVLTLNPRDDATTDALH